MAAGSGHEVTQNEPQAEQEGSKTILLVEDDISNADMLQLLLQTETSYQLVQFVNENEIFQRIDEIKAMRPDLFLFDYRLSSMTALDLYDQLHNIEGLQDVPTIIITASIVNEEEFAKRKIPLIQKPFDVDELLRSIDQTIA
jgi:CheY-like chemotaxis protein